MSRQFRFAIGIAVILSAIAYFAVAGYNEGKAYYRTIDEVMAMGPASDARRLRVAGIVQEGSIVRDGKNVTFTLTQDAEHAMAVRYTGNQPVPDTFKDRAEAIVEGRRGADGTFEADHIQAKCASKYEAQYGANAQHPTKDKLGGAGAAPATGAADTASAGGY
jgi:cytochrome c-type biogenesis protein CcmE